MNTQLIELCGELIAKLQHAGSCTGGSPCRCGMDVFIEGSKAQLEQLSQSPPPAAGLVEAVSGLQRYDIPDLDGGGMCEHSDGDWLRRDDVLAALTAPAAPSGGVVEALRAELSVWRDHAEVPMHVEHELRRLRNATDLALSSAPAAQQDVNRELLAAAKWVVNDATYKAPEQLTASYVTERWIDRLQSAITAAEQPTPPPAYQDALKSAQQFIDDALVYLPESLQPRASEVTKLLDAAIGGTPSQDAAGEGVRWFASCKDDHYFESNGEQTKLFGPTRRCGESQPVITLQVLLDAEAKGRDEDRELTRADVDAIRATWPPSPVEGA